VVARFAAAWLCAAQGVASAAVITVDCDLGDSIGAALAALDPAGPHTINLRGICVEAVTINERARVTITGDATIDATGTGLPVINIARSHNIFIDGLTLTGGSVGLRAGRGSSINASNVRSHDNQAHGVLVSRNAVLLGSVMQLDHNGGAGIRVDYGVASLDNMTIEDNAGNGVVGAAARINLLADYDDPSWISRNGGSGIALTSGSRGNFAGPSIAVEGNAGKGVLTAGVSAMNLFAATVTNNGDTGIDVRGKSHGGFGDLVVSDNGDATNGGGIRVAHHSDVSIDGNVSVTGNGGDALTCDESSLVVGDLTGFPELECTNVDREPEQRTR
jgi:hypothetical protein